LNRPDASGTSVAAPVGDREGVAVVEGLITEGLGVLVIDCVRNGDDEAPTGGASINVEVAPGLEPTEDTDGAEPSEHTKLLSCPILEGRMLRYVTTALKT